jgi:chorismate-pyruvate lyase
MGRFRLLSAVIAGVLTLLPRIAAAEPPSWPDNFLTRVEALALMQSLNAELLASRSATLTLEKWCGEHHLAEPAKVVALLERSIDKAPDADQRARLKVSETEVVHFRRVKLICGDQLLSEADNWYVPSRLTEEMNRLLETTDTPFGKAVLALEPTRQTFAAKVLWSPLPEGWEMAPVPKEQGRGTLAMPDALFEHRAVLYTKDKVPFSEVDEVYQRQILAFPPPAR